MQHQSVCRQALRVPPFQFTLEHLQFINSLYNPSGSPRMSWRPIAIAIDFEQLAMQVTGEASPEVAVREVMQRWERTTQRACEAVTRTIEHVAKMVA